MDFDSLPVSVVRRIDRVSDAFEAAWRGGGRPRIEDHLGDMPEPGRSALLRALLVSELEARQQLGEQPAPDEYLGRFPADTALIRSAFGGDAAPGDAREPGPAAEADGPGGWSISRAFTRSLLGTGRSLGKHLWIWPLVVGAILAGAAFWAHVTIERVIQDEVTSELLALRDADVEALRLLFGAHQAIASIAAADPRVRAPIQRILAADGGDDAGDLLRSPDLAQLRAVLQPWLGQYEYDGFCVIDRRGRILAARRDVTIGGPAGQEEIDCLDTVFAGRATVSRPRPADVRLPDIDGVERLGLPTMFVLAPIPGDGGQAIAALGFRMRPESTFTRILNVARFGRTGETYAFDRAGLLLSGSRFDDDLKRVGLIADEPHIRSTLSLELRDPGVDMTAGGRPGRRRGEQPLTRLVARAVEGASGVDVHGCRDYRGVPVIGAWTWLPDYGIGVVTKVDYAEAYRPLTILHAAFRGLFALLVAASVALLVSTVLVARLRRRVRAAALVVERLGRYTLDGKIGEGGMGIVYRARHVMLRRPTAIKLLSPEKTDEKSIARFEREVQLTSQLTHPNTITIYDYGRTSEGMFYYAMEYLDGIDLQSLVAHYGPQPEGRVIHILTHVCGSLAEAHGIGLIHRDIKPSNIILARRGGIPDFAKLVDFGLVKVMDAAQVAELTSSDAIVGTPNYMAPEAIRFPESSDALSDLYSVGAVGYFLLTGRPLFEGRSIAEILLQHLSTEPESPSARRGDTVSPELEALLLACLAKDPAGRPPSARALAEALGRVSAGTWSTAEAEVWWRAHDQSPPAPADPGGPATPGVASAAPMRWDGTTIILGKAENIGEWD